MTDDEAQAAKNKLEQAVKEYYHEVEPDVFVDDWVLVVHKDSVELSAANQSIVSQLVPTGQAFHRTTGLLTLAAAAVVKP